MKIIDRKGLRTWVEIDRKAIKHNYKVLRSLLSPKTRFLSVVKSNAYGHGLVDFSLEAQKLGADWFGVDSIVEAIALREAGVKKPILVLGYTLPEMLSKAIKHDISISVSTFELLHTIKIIKHSVSNTKHPVFGKVPIKIHIKADTGMHRQGFQEGDIRGVIKELKNLEQKIEVEGLFTHFAGVYPVRDREGPQRVSVSNGMKNPKFEKATKKQIQSFNIWAKALVSAGFKPLIHAGATGGGMILPEAHFDMVRFGIAQYGLWPSDEIKKDFRKKINFKPILQWRTLVGEIKNIPKDERVGYDFTEKLKKDSKVAICPIGYWHGYPRALSRIGYVLVRCKMARVLGRVSMDMLTINVSDVKGVKVGDVVTLLGRDGKAVVSAEQIGKWSGTSAYEIITRINPLIKRIYFS